MGWLRWLVAVFVLSIACGPQTLPPFAQAQIWIDTDVPVPRFASRLRIDVYDEKARWIDSRDALVLEPRDFPTSFTVYAPSDTASPIALVRIRLYSRSRPYRGERFFDRETEGDPGAPAFEDEGVPLALLKNGADATPREEPQPFLAVDRLVKVKLEPGVSGRVRVVLRGACFATMADLFGQRSCIDTEGTLAAVMPAPIDTSTEKIPDEAKIFGKKQPCPSDSDAPARKGREKNGVKLFDQDVCIDGGGFVFGSDDNYGAGDLSGTPEHMAVLPPFFMDRFEVTVARWRDAVARGFVPPANGVTPNPQPFLRDSCVTQPTSTSAYCTYTPQAGPYETLAMTCVKWAAARAFCEFEGGDLPTEAQWEYVARVAGRPARTRTPWGDISTVGCAPAPSVNGVVWGRYPVCSGGIEGREGCLDLTGAEECKLNFGPQHKCGMDPKIGPQPVDLMAVPGGDVSITYEIVGMMGGVAELMRDAARSLGSVCWAKSPVVSPVCDDPFWSTHTVRGGAWSWLGYELLPAYRWPGKEPPDPKDKDVQPSTVGFRCVRPVPQ